jgi:nitroimidazol reductase NimA-like FMN-containing flavoprotein (pyridoxamine 5'-phosphate oxidase superfamily)
MGDRKDGSKMGVLSDAECYRLLIGRSVGRIGVVIDGYPLIIPVNYSLERETVVVRTAPGSVVARADGARVSFQVDEFDSVKKLGWSVLLRGRLDAVTLEDAPELVERTRATGVSPWAPGERHQWMRISPHGISGRRIETGEDLDWRLGTAAYM